MSLFFAAMVGMGYLIAPIMLVWGWTRWTLRRDELGPPFFLSFIGFMLSTASGILAVSTIVYAFVIRAFPFYDPMLLRIYAWGCLLSASGIVLGFTGVSKPNALRWHAPLAGLGMLAFWIVAAAGELRLTEAIYKSGGSSPVCFAIFDSIFGPISSLSWKPTI